MLNLVRDVLNHLWGQLTNEKGFVGETPEKDETASEGAEDSPASDKGTEVNGSIADIDFSDISDEKVRKLVQEKTASKVKNFQSGVTKKTEELKKTRERLDLKEKNLSDWESIKTTVEGDSVLAGKLNKVMDDHRTGKSVSDTKAATDKKLNTIDRLLDTAEDASTKEDLRRLRDIVKEESGVSVLQDQVRVLEDELKLIRSTTRSVQTDRVKRGLETLKDDFGNVVEKYEDLIKSNAIKYPGLTVRQIFRQIADENDVATAYLTAAKKREKKETVKQKEGLGPSGAETVTKPEDIPRLRSGRIDNRANMERLVRKHKLDQGI